MLTGLRRRIVAQPVGVADRFDGKAICISTQRSKRAMRIRLTYLVMALLVLSLGATLPAVEKTPKKTPTREQPKPPAEKPKDPPKVKPKEPTPAPKKFDDFVDKNKNGVDDRKENLPQKEAK
jgi:hypothetical protein